MHNFFSAPHSKRLDFGYGILAVCVRSQGIFRHVILYDIAVCVFIPQKQPTVIKITSFSCDGCVFSLLYTKRNLDVYLIKL